MNQAKQEYRKVLAFRAAETTNPLNCPDAWENHLRRCRELEAMLEEMGVPHTKLKDRDSSGRLI